MEKGTKTESGVSTPDFLDLFGMGGKEFNSISGKTEPVEEVVTPVGGVQDVTEVDVEISTEPTKPVEETTEIKKEPETVETVEEGSIESLMTSLVDVLEFDEEKEFAPTVEGLKELITETKATASKQAVEAYKASLGDRGSKLAEVIEKGGNVEDFIAMETRIDFEKIPLVNAAGEPLLRNQRNLVEDWLVIQGFEEAEIEERLQDLEANRLLEKEAKFSQRKLSEYHKKQDELLVETKAKELEVIKQKEEAEALTFKNKVLEIKEVKGFKLEKDQSKKLYEYITKVDRNGKTQFEKDTNEDTQLLYAYFAMTGFDKEKLSKEIMTEKTIKLKKNLSNYTDGNVKSRSAENVRRGTDEVLNIPWKM